MQQTLKEKLKEDLKVALKTGNSIKKNIIKVILSEVALEEGRGSASFFLNDEGVLSVIKKCKKSQETIKEGYEKLKKEIPEEVLKEIKILDSYIPQQMSEDIIQEQINAMIEETGCDTMKDMGMLMTMFNKKFAGKADNRIVSQILREKLNGN